MKNFSNFLFVTVFLTLSSGCSRGFYYFSGEIPTHKTLDLDSAEFYTRKLYSIKTDSNKQRLISIEKDILPEGNYSSSDMMLSEVQYLLIRNDSAIYITTTPQRYIYDKEDTYIINDHVNAYFINSYYFGKVLNRTATSIELHFKNKSSQSIFYFDVQDREKMILNLVDDYTYKTSQQVKEINTMRPANALANPIIFEKHPYSFSLVHRKPSKSEKEADFNASLIDKQPTTSQLKLEYYNNKVVKVYIEVDNRIMLYGTQRVVYSW